MGRVKSSSTVPVLRSSDHSRMATAGTSTTNSIGMKLKNGSRLA